MNTKITVIHAGFCISERVASGSMFFNLSLEYVLADQVPERRIVFDLETGSNNPLEVAEAVFDMAGNPNRDDEWTKVAGKARAVCTGDAVLVQYIHEKITHYTACLSCGWYHTADDETGQLMISVLASLDPTQYLFLDLRKLSGEIELARVREVAKIAEIHLGTGDMRDSAGSCFVAAADAYTSRLTSEAIIWLLRSIAYSIGILHSDYSAAWKKSGLKGSCRLV